MPKRCLRCGLEKTGPEHSANAPKNSAEYCAVVPSDYALLWKTPAGYEAGDEHKPMELKAVKRERRRLQKRGEKERSKSI